MTTDLIKDLSTLTTIPEKALSSLAEKASLCICDAIADMKAAGEGSVEISLGFGALIASSDGQSLRFRFVPDAKLGMSAAKAAKTGESALTATLEAALVDHVTNTYKDILG